MNFLGCGAPPDRRSAHLPQDFRRAVSAVEQPGKRLRRRFALFGTVLGDRLADAWHLQFRRLLRVNDMVPTQIELAKRG